MNFYILIGREIRPKLRNFSIFQIKTKIYIESQSNSSSKNLIDFITNKLSFIQKLNGKNYLNEISHKFYRTNEK